jgi:hypothetical protein
MDREPVAATPTSPTPPLIVRGSVLDFQTSQPIPGAVVGFATDIGFPGAPIGITETAVTDTNGRYSLPEPPLRGDPPAGYYLVVNNQIVGRGYPRSTNYRADLAIDRGKCVTRYGMVLDRRTFAPIAGASILNLGNRVLATSDRDGWYQVDFGCGVGWVGFNTTWLIMSHPNYNSSNFAGGRGIVGLFREDVVLSAR